jgi:basic membrane protein A
MKRLLLLILILILTGVASCSKQKNYEPIRVGIVLTTSGLGKNTYNDSALKGLNKAREDFGIDFVYRIPSTIGDDVKLLEQFAREDYDLIIATGFLMNAACEQVASEYQGSKFAIIDSVVELPNVSSLLFKDNEAAFLLGLLNAEISESGNVGFIGGGQLPLIRNIHYGYSQGVDYINSSIQVKAAYLTGANSFNDPLQGKKQTNLLIEQGVDAVFHIAGNSSIGVIEACREKGVYISGEKGIPNGTSEIISGEIVRNADVAVYNIVEAVLEKEFDGSVRSFGIAENGVDIDIAQHIKSDLSEEFIKSLGNVKDRVRSGDIIIEEL